MSRGWAVAWKDRQERDPKPKPRPHTVTHAGTLLPPPIHWPSSPSPFHLRNLPPPPARIVVAVAASLSDRQGKTAGGFDRQLSARGDANPQTQTQQRSAYSPSVRNILRVVLEPVGLATT